MHMQWFHHTRATTNALLLVAVMPAALGRAVRLAAGETCRRCLPLVMPRATHEQDWRL